MNRRDVIKLLSASVAGGVLGGLRSTAVPAVQSNQSYQGDDLTGWEVALGDALHTCSPEPNVTLTDIDTIHNSTYSALRANTTPRKIMAHNITFKRIIDSTAFDYLHTATYAFRLPYTPQPDANAAINGQTIEGGLFVWDGAAAKLDYGMAWQWDVNPWSTSPGIMRVWNGSGWIDDRVIPIDQAWHTVEMVIDYPCQTTSLKIDNNAYMSMFTSTIKTDWGDEIAARLQAEAISVDPRNDCIVAAAHNAEFRNWRWDWVHKSNCVQYIPLVQKRA
jgi:hypothetical protein